MTDTILKVRDREEVWTLPSESSGGSTQDKGERVKISVEGEKIVVEVIRDLALQWKKFARVSADEIERISMEERKRKRYRTLQRRLKRVFKVLMYHSRRLSDPASFRTINGCRFGKKFVDLTQV